MKMKCTQCGCTDLNEVNFPMEVGFNNDGYENVKIDNPYRPYEQKFVRREPILRQTQYDGDGGAVTFELENQYFCKTYICTQCGHFEFFNKKLAEQILANRQATEEISKKISDVDKQIEKLNDKNFKCENEILHCNEELKNLDITVRRSNELQEKIKSLQNEIKEVKKEIGQKQTEKSNLEKELKDFE